MVAIRRLLFDERLPGHFRIRRVRAPAAGESVVGFLALAMSAVAVGA